MISINWTKDYSVGVEEIDEQHQKIIAIINRIFKLYDEKNFTSAGAEEIFQELEDYADYHFSIEEHYFGLYHYEKTEEHLAMHEQYRNKLKDLKEKYEAEKNEKILFEINEFLQDWWIWHINNADKEYTDCFHKNGLY